MLRTLRKKYSQLTVPVKKIQALEHVREIKLCTKYYIDAIGMVEQFLFRCNTIIRRPSSALLDKLLCLPGPGGPAATG